MTILRDTEGLLILKLLAALVSILSHAPSPW